MRALIPSKKSTRLAVLTGFALAAAPAHAAITYVDAVEGGQPGANTFATGGSLGTTTWMEDPGSSGSNETQWGKRADVGGNGPTIFQALHEVVLSDDMPELTTQITGLADGTYEIWAFYWDQVVSATQNWTLSAGLTSGSLESYSSPGQPAVAGATTVDVSNAASLTFSNSVTVVENASLSTERNMFGVYLGQAIVSGGSTVNVYVDNLLGNGSLNRSWFDGVGYQLIPEPSSIALLGLGGLALGLRRRRR